MKSLLTLLRLVMPYPAKYLLRLIIQGFRAAKFLANYRFLPPPPGTDLTGYETLIRFLEVHKLLEVNGEIVEIGAFLGGGTYKLAKYLERKGSQKRVYVLDIFDIYADRTECTQGISMADLYERAVRTIGKGLSQWDIFQMVTKKCKNIEIIKGDSKMVELPTSSICFAFIDGNHDPAYVRNDFYLVWTKLSTGGVCAFDDYGHDLPQVTATINELIGHHAHQITVMGREGKIIFLQKRKEN